MVEKFKIKYTILNDSSYEQSNISSNQDGQSDISSNQDLQKLKQSLKEEFLKINEQGLENDKFMLYINKIFENKLINDNSFLYNFLKDKKIQPHEIIYMINLLIDDKNYENQLLNDINDIKKINCLLNYSRQNFIPNEKTQVFDKHFTEYNHKNCNLIFGDNDIINFQKYYEYIDIENKYCLMLFDKLPLTHKSYDNNHEMIIENKEEMILENKEEMLNQTLINVLRVMVDTLYEKKFFNIYLYIA